MFLIQYKEKNGTYDFTCELCFRFSDNNAVYRWKGNGLDVVGRYFSTACNKITEDVI